MTAARFAEKLEVRDQEDHGCSTDSQEGGAEGVELGTDCSDSEENRLGEFPFGVRLLVSDVLDRQELVDLLPLLSCEGHRYPSSGKTLSSEPRSSKFLELLVWCACPGTLPGDSVGARFTTGSGL